ncbi:MAG: Glu/Leu/Phe/Val dehydrogenase [Acidobacteria bacterium]|nr:Glu/Leu/Phe/Val dehydrogenase [Acidobacteriota bacterium]
MREPREIEVVTEDGRMAGFLVVEGSDRELSFGGMRVDPAVTRELVAELAENMSLKLAGHGSPVGGAKAGIRASPDDPRLKDFLGHFARGCGEVLGSTTVLGKDMGAKPWMLEEIYACLGMPQLEIARRRSSNGRCPERIGELDGYIPHMTGQGVFWAIDQALGAEVRGARVLIQGFGVVGAGVAWHLSRAGARIAGVSDREKAVVGPELPGLEELMAAKTDDGIVLADRLPPGPGSRPWQVVERDALLSQEAEVLVLAASSHLVDASLASGIRARVVVEGANMALRPEARAVLLERGVRVVPDVVANSASAALVGHQMAAANGLEPGPLWAAIEANIRRNTDEVHRASREQGTDPKEAFRRLAAAGRVAGRSERPEAALARSEAG